MQASLSSKAERRIRTALAERYRSNSDTGAAYDMRCTGVLHPISSEAVKACLPNGQSKLFPDNCLSLMTVTGAKGSVVNFSQVCQARRSCCSCFSRSACRSWLVVTALFDALDGCPSDWWTQQLYSVVADLGAPGSAGA